jgi:hypothetical protein
MAAAEPRPVGPVVSYALDSGLDANVWLRLAFDSKARSVAVWHHWDDDADRSDIAMLRFGPAGQRVGPQTWVNQHTLDFQHRPEVAMNAAGSYVVSWSSNGQTAKLSSAYARLYRWREPVTGEIELGAEVPGVTDGIPRVGVDAAGGFVAVWEVLLDNGRTYVYARLYDRDGAARGPAFRVAVGSFDQNVPDVAVRPDGRFVVVWRTWNYGAPRAAMYARFFAADGTPATPEIRVSQTTVINQGYPRVAVGPDGAAVVAWERCDFAHFENGCSVAMRRLGPDGRFRGGERVVSPADKEGHQDVGVAFDARGSFAVTWDDCLVTASGDRYDCRVQTAFYTPAGALRGRREIDSKNDLTDPAVTGLASGFMVSWDTVNCDVTGCPGGSTPQGVFAQRYAVE